MSLSIEKITLAPYSNYISFQITKNLSYCNAVLTSVITGCLCMLLIFFTVSILADDKAKAGTPN